MFTPMKIQQNAKKSIEISKTKIYRLKIQLPIEFSNLVFVQTFAQRQYLDKCK